MNALDLLRSCGVDADDELLAHLQSIHPGSIRIRPASTLMRRLWGEGINAMTWRKTVSIDPAMLVADDRVLARLIIHEVTHANQWADLGAARFLICYFGDYLRGRLSGLKHREAYLAIALEREARAAASRCQIT